MEVAVQELGGGHSLGVGAVEAGSGAFGGLAGYGGYVVGGREGGADFGVGEQGFEAGGHLDVEFDYGVLDVVAGYLGYDGFGGGCFAFAELGVDGEEAAGVDGVEAEVGHAVAARFGRV